MLCSAARASLRSIPCCRAVPSPLLRGAWVQSMGGGRGCISSKSGAEAPQQVQQQQQQPRAGATTPAALAASGGGATVGQGSQPPQGKTSPSAALSTTAAAATGSAAGSTHVAKAAGGSTGGMGTTKIFIVYYSLYGHIYKMAQAVKEGVDSVEGCEGVLYQVPETLSDEVLQKMHAPPKPDVPLISADKLPEADGFLFGIPTRYGVMAGQMKAFWDTTGKLWTSQALVGKGAGIFVSTGTQGGGQEVTVTNSLSTLSHHGMIIIPTGYTYGDVMFDVTEVRGGSAWGAGTFAGADGSRQPSKRELGFATHQGKYTAEVIKKLCAK